MPCIRQSAAIVLVTAVLAGCATAPPAPVVTYARQDCPASPNLAAAISLVSRKPKAVYDVTTNLDATSPCLGEPGGASPYQVYALPPDAPFKTLTVGSVLEAGRLLPPKISILDRDGKVTRSFPDGDFFFRGAVYSVQFQPKAGEAYVLVTTDRAKIGKEYKSIAIGTTTTSGYTRGGAFSWTRGLDQAESRTFSFDGAVDVSVYDNRAEQTH